MHELSDFPDTEVSLLKKQLKASSLYSGNTVLQQYMTEKNISSRLLTRGLHQSLLCKPLSETKVHSKVQHWMKGDDISRIDAMQLVLFFDSYGGSGSTIYVEKENWFEDAFDYEPLFPWISSEGQVNLPEFILCCGLRYGFDIQRCGALLTAAKRILTNSSHIQPIGEAAIMDFFCRCASSNKPQREGLILDFISQHTGAWTCYYGYRDQLMLPGDRLKKLFSGELIPKYAEDITMLMLESSLTRFFTLNPFNQVSTEAFRKRIERWLDFKNPLHIDRTEGFVLCMLLGLSLNESQGFFTQALHQPWMHPKRCEEIIFDFCIRFSLPLMQAEELIEHCSRKEGIAFPSRESRPTVYLRQSYQEALSLWKNTDAKSLKECFLNYLDSHMDDFMLQKSSAYHAILPLLDQPLDALAEKLCKTKLACEFGKQSYSDKSIDYVRSCRDMLRQYKKRDPSREISRYDLVRFMLLFGESNTDNINKGLDNCGFYPLSCDDPFDILVSFACKNASFGKDVYPLLCQLKNIFIDVLDY